MEEEEEPRSRIDDIKYYTSMFLGTVAINALFAFLFLVPFILDPAISTMMHDFVEKPVHCKVKLEALRLRLIEYDRSEYESRLSRFTDI